MHRLVSLLPPDFYQDVQTIWKNLELQHGLQGIKRTPFPHIAWHTAEDYDFDRLEERIRAAARDLPPITIRTAGLGLLSGPRPVLFIPVVKNMALMDMHATLWERLGRAAHGLSPLYEPAQWMPHIRLAYEDVDQTNLAQVILTLCANPFAWEMTIDNLALIYQPTGAMGELRYHIKFQGGEKEP
jgi:2'-5' RNA ligase